MWYKSRDKKISGCLQLRVLGENGELTTKRNEVPSWSDENVLKMIVVRVAQLCDYTKNQCIIHTKQMHFICM